MSEKKTDLNTEDLFKEMEFVDLEPIVVPVKIRNGKGELKEYQLREAGLPEAVRYKMDKQRAFKFSPSGLPSHTEGTTEADVNLLASCLFEKGREAPVGKEHINGIKPDTVFKLIHRLKGISPGLTADVDEEQLAKKIKELMGVKEQLDNGTLPGSEEHGKNSQSAGVLSSGTATN